MPWGNQRKLRKDGRQTKQLWHYEGSYSNQKSCHTSWTRATLLNVETSKSSSPEILNTKSIAPYASCTSNAWANTILLSGSYHQATTVVSMPAQAAPISGESAPPMSIVPLAAEVHLSPPLPSISKPVFPTPKCTKVNFATLRQYQPL